MIWIIIGLLLDYSVGYLTSSWNSSKKIAKLQDEVDSLKLRNTNLETKLQKAQSVVDSYPTYDVKV